MKDVIASAILITAAGTSLFLPAFAASFKTFHISADQKHLVITRTDGSRVEAPLLPKQVEFASAGISADGSYVGWLALYPNISYPVPVYLVVMDSAGHVQKFKSEALIFEWCFLPDSKSVAYMYSSLHFTDYEGFEWRSLYDKHLLGKYEYPDDSQGKPGQQAINAREKAVKNAPEWVKCVPKSPLDEDY